MYTSTMGRFLLLVFFSVCLTGQICFGIKNLCRYKIEDSTINTAFAKRSELCSGNKRECKRLFGWLKPTPSGYYEDCCPGWTHKTKLGCIKRTCIALPQDVQKFPLRLTCAPKRKINLGLQKRFYKLTKPLDEPLSYPNQTKNLLEAVPFPLLDQPSVNVLLRSITSSDESGWVIRYLGMAKRNEKMAEETKKTLPEFTTYSDYDKLFKEYLKVQPQPLVSLKIPFLPGKTFDFISMEQYMRYPSQELPFKDIIQHNDWQNDDVFAMQRLAGLNTMSLRKMTMEDFNKNHFNKTYDWDAAMQRASGQELSFKEMISTGKVFIIDYELLFDLTNVEDYTERNTTDRREMRGSRSPLCVFVSTANGLKPVAIQTDLRSDAPVFSPVDGLKWLMAKQEFQNADILYSQLIEHLLKTHLVMEPICVILRCTVSKYHPLFQLLKWHCRGLFVTNSLGIKALLDEGEFLHKLFAVGHVGAIEFLNEGYKYSTWKDTEFKKNLKRRGVDDVNVLPYFPYRDDGMLIFEQVEGIAKEYVKLYYHTDKDVTDDFELSNFANHLSADGTGTECGNGMIKEFPVKIQTVAELIDVITRIVFIPIQHHAVNYPVAYYGGFVPNMPSKLYDDPRVPYQEFGFDRLPQSHVATEQISLFMTLGSIRYDTIFDYGDHLKDDRAKAVVKKYHERLIGEVNDKITQRNKERLADGKLSYPYLLPKWLPNSIHT
ncbi:arachidonate 5-lipoxygenase-like [Dendronephthya gigantea]|uniref:arachidonate 5-lipoxygenase-like n=1 Tax=Dendronephthya gigantea TaxID=151771 RepID=UPI00106A3709|nr:arachidonate 5-lipoxygenase-like [Dendronephthya gigantea]